MDGKTSLFSVLFFRKQQIEALRFHNIARYLENKFKHFLKVVVMQKNEIFDAELKAYKVLKHFFHDPRISNSDAKRLYSGFSKLFPNSRFKNKLLSKLIWHRFILGYKYKKSVTDIFGISNLKKRLNDTSSGQNKGKDVLLISHEMSLTGAPRALMNMAIILKQSGFNPYIFALRGGGLCEEAEKAGIPVIVDLYTLLSMLYLDSAESQESSDFFKSFPVAIFNTMECITMFPTIKNWPAHKLGWIHESAESYRGLTREEFEKHLSGFEDIFIVGNHARANARSLTPMADSFKNLNYGVEELDERKINKREKFDDSRLHLIMAGTLEERKGYHILARAVKLLTPEERSLIKVHCAGGDNAQWVKDELIGVGDDVIVLEGCLKHSQLIDLMEVCDALICPSLDDPMPIVCTEAFQLKIPVLTSSKTGTASYISEGENGFVVEANSPQDLADGLRKLLRNKGKLPEIGKRGYKIYEDNFSMKVFKKSILDIFDKYYQQS